MTTSSSFQGTLSNAGGGGGAAAWDAVLAAGNASGGTSPIISSGDKILGDVNAPLEIESVPSVGGGASGAPINITAASSPVGTGDDGADVNITAGNGEGGAGGGVVTVRGGDGDDEVGGGVDIIGGDAVTAGVFEGGRILLQPGANSTNGDRNQIRCNAELSLVQRSTPVTEATRGNVFVSDGSGGLVTGGLYYLRGDGTLLHIDGVREAWLTGTNFNGNRGDFRARNIGNNGAFRFSFSIPQDFGSLVSIGVVGISTAGAAGAGKNIDLTSDYGALGELFNTNSEADTTTSYTIPTNGTLFELDFGVVLSALAAGDFCGVLVNHIGVGGTINYIGVRLRYIPR